MAKGNPFGAKKAPPFGGKGKSVAKEAKAEGEPLGVEKREQAMGFRRGGHVKRGGRGK
jgi:hypothetical protein